MARLVGGLYVCSVMVLFKVLHMATNTELEMASVVSRRWCIMTAIPDSNMMVSLISEECQ